MSMNKLEKAISLTMNAHEFDDIQFSGVDASKSMEEIAKMSFSKVSEKDYLDRKKIVYPKCSQEKLVNQLRDIRTELSKHQVKNLVMITSVIDEAGVSFFSKNIAAVNAFDASKSSLLIDCNLTSPSVDDTFDLKGKPGLLDYVLNQEIQEKDIIHEVGISRYRALPAGNMKAESSEYFTHPRFKKLLFSLKNRYQDRTIFLDAPPLLDSADARILVGLCDLVILVLPSGKISKNKIEAAAKVIPKEKLMGAIINNNIY